MTAKDSKKVVYSNQTSPGIFKDVSAQTDDPHMVDFNTIPILSDADDLRRHVIKYEFKWMRNGKHVTTVMKFKQDGTYKSM